MKGRIMNDTNNQILSIVIHIYNNQKALNLQIQSWKTWRGIPNLELIFIDDCSKPQLDISAVPTWVRKVRIIDDISWNQPGAKNLGAKLASGAWLMFLDADQFFNKSDILKLITLLVGFRQNTIYRFKRRCSKNNLTLDVHQNCQLISKQDYENFGGYDEDFAGNYGHEDAYFERLWKFKRGKIEVLNELCLSDHPELSTAGLNRNSLSNKLLRRRKMRYWHVIKNPIGRFILANPLILKLLFKMNFLANGQPTKKIRFNWKEF
jgi:glycosyltransferase involved in cell wall biosynthesis